MTHHTEDEPDGRTRPEPRARWTADQAAAIERTPETVAPGIDPPDSGQFPHVHIWDTWLLRDRHGEVATLDGWRVAFSLTASSELLPGTRHDVAEIRSFYSRDGRTWHDGGPVFDGGALGQRQWAGSALVDDGALYLYYTAAGDDDGDDLGYTQRIAVGHGGTVAAADDGVTIDGPWTHELLLEPDGRWYETEAQSEGMTYTFRDPWFYEDPATGRAHLLFEANTPVPDDVDCDGDPARREFNGCVGVAVSPTGDPLEWEFRPPLLDAVCVNQELERPHVVRQDGRYYLFVSSHEHTFVPGIEGYDGLYGFVADSLDGDYRPLNGSGLVATNPATTPFQAYSWMAYPHQGEVLVQSFVNYHDFEGASLDDIAHLPEHRQRERFGGMLAPTLRLAVTDDSSRIRGTLGHWEVPAGSEPLPALERDDLPAGAVDTDDDSDPEDAGSRDDETRSTDYYY